MDVATLNPIPEFSNIKSTSYWEELCLATVQLGSHDAVLYTDARGTARSDHATERIGLEEGW